MCIVIAKRKDYSSWAGQRYGRLTVTGEEIRMQDGRAKLICVCDCGTVCEVAPGNLRAGNVRSCGCLSKDRSHKQLYVHGDTGERLWHIWSGMRRRCEETCNKDYPRYGGRGISVCEEWHDYSIFKEWALSHGYNDKLTLDRIDSNGNYEPANCRWATAKEQNNNRRSNHILEYNGERHTISQWSELSGVPSKTLLYRINAGWTVEQALYTPVNHNNRLVKHT